MLGDVAAKPFFSAQSTQALRNRRDFRRAGRRAIKPVPLFEKPFNLFGPGRTHFLKLFSVRNFVVEDELHLFDPLIELADVLSCRKSFPPRFAGKRPYLVQVGVV